MHPSTPMTLLSIRLSSRPSSQGCVRLVSTQLSQLSESRPDFVLRLLADSAGVQEYQIRFHHIVCLPITVRSQNRQDHLREHLSSTPWRICSLTSESLTFIWHPYVSRYTRWRLELGLCGVGVSVRACKGKEMGFCCRHRNPHRRKSELLLLFQEMGQIWSVTRDSSGLDTPGLVS